MKVAFRVDASSDIGTGHAVRCLTLADSLRKCGVETLVVARRMTDPILAQIKQKGHAFCMLPQASAECNSGSLQHSHWLGVSQLVDCKATQEALRGRRYNWLVVDHYGLDAVWQRGIKSCAERILAIDDLADRRQECDALLDQNMQPLGSERYRGLVSQNCKLLLGPRFALLRPEFRNAARQRCRSGQVRRVNIFFGGIDAPAMTLRALDAVERVRLPELALDVIVGGSNPRLQEIEQRCNSIKNATLHVQTDEIANIFAQADLALGAGGSTSWERCACGLPSIVVSIADNQRSGCQAMAEADVAIYLGDSANVTNANLVDAMKAAMSDAESLKAMGSRAKSACDGRGIERVLLFMTKENTILRRATAGDADQAWIWRNDPATRRYFNNPSPIAWSEHKDWWDISLGSASRDLLVASVSGIDFAIIRFDYGDKAATISIYVDPQLTGLALGSSVIRAGCDWIENHRPGTNILRAEIHGANQSSQNAFRAAGFTRQGPVSWQRGVRAHV